MRLTRQRTRPWRGFRNARSRNTKAGHCGEVGDNLEQLLRALEILPLVSIRTDMGFGRLRDVRYACRNAFRHDRNGYRYAC
jgi:hypothetical protein